jgi:predicted RNA binding protein YcfA (HicA-like mRNA interferase family)
MSRLTPKHSQTLIKAFRRAGFQITRQTGSHIIMKKAGIIRPLVIQEGPDVPVTHIKDLLQTAGISRSEFFDLLKG